jgi:hypothetical protein
MAYATAADLRARLQKTSTDEDDVLTALIAAAERNINRACNRPDGFVADAIASARKYAGSGKPYQYIDECISVSAVAVKESATDDDYTDWTSADYIEASGDPEYPDYNSLPYDLLVVDPTGDESVFASGKYTTRGGFRPLTDVSRGVPTVQVTAKWGYSEDVPYDIKEACLMQAARWYKRFEGSMSDALASGELGTLLYRQSLDPDIRRLLVDGRYVKPTTGRR